MNEIDRPPARDPTTMLVVSIAASVIVTLVLIFVAGYLRAHLRWVPSQPAQPVVPPPGPEPTPRPPRPFPSGHITPYHA